MAVLSKPEPVRSGRDGGSGKGAPAKSLDSFAVPLDFGSLSLEADSSSSCRSCDGAEEGRPAVKRSVSPFAAHSLASAASAGSHDSSLSHISVDDELQDKSGLRTIRELQRGSSGVIVLAEEKTGRTPPVAVKLLPLDHGIPALSSEIITQRSCMMHPHVIQFKEAFLMQCQLAIVMEYAAGGDLREYLEYTRPDNRGLPEADARWFFQQLMLGVDFCHRLGIAHQDIKLENALLDGNSSRALLKLCDFGYSVRNEANPGGPVMCHRAVGTPDYMAPELLLSPTNYDGKVADVWACGVLLYTLVVGCFPFWREEDEAQQSDPASRLRCMALRIVKADYSLPEYVSPQCAQLLGRMLNPCPSERATVQWIIDCDWFQEGLPPGCTQLNDKLLRMLPSKRTAACRQSDTDILRMTRRVSAP